LKKSTKSTLIIIATIVGAFVGGMIFLYILFPSALSKEATEKDFIKNYDHVKIVTDYFAGSKYNEMSIRHTGDGHTIFANADGYITINDVKVIDAISSLFENGYKVIAKSDNSVHFLRSSPTMDFGSGVVYSIDGSEPTLEILTKLEPLAEPNWYYYEQSYNEWRMPNGN